MEKAFVSHGDIILDKIYDGDLNLIKQEGGGCNWNTLYNLALWVKSALLLVLAGSDVEGELSLNSLKNAGVDISNILIEDKRTNVMNIIIPSTKLAVARPLFFVSFSTIFTPPFLLHILIY